MPSLHPRILLLRCNWGPRLRSLSTTTPAYAGHNKWSKIQQKKGVSDQRRSQVYARASRDIMIAARHGGSVDPEKNVALFNAIKKARAGDVPKANIESALQKAACGKEGAGQLITYEVLAYGSVGLIMEKNRVKLEGLKSLFFLQENHATIVVEFPFHTVLTGERECLTDNRNRTLHQFREIFNKHDARFATVMFMFRHQGHVRVALSEQDVAGGGVDRLFDNALAAGAEDFDQVPGADRGVEVEITCAPKALGRITDTVTQSGFSLGLLSSELVYVPAEDAVVDAERDSRITELVASLEENEGTLRVWTTLDS